MDPQSLLAKIKKLQNTAEFDLSRDEDLSLAVMNLVSLEEHFFFTAAKTEKPEFFAFVQEIREMRKKLLEKLLGGKPEGELWCISKHLLGTSMRLMEVATKLQGQKRQKEAGEMFASAYQIYNLFWKLKLGMLKEEDLPARAAQEPNTTQEQIDDLMKKLVDCCKE